ncbi:hypothetical protein [Roseateles sp. L2-2]|uniref:hypothetical protein n=1 Tax=Roseateles sp. L2-2 TaxID=3422597 RepID=UPI003D35BFEF
MTTKPEDLKSVAEALSIQEIEAWQRSAISRAYYASFHRCLEWESGLPKRPYVTQQKGGEHQQLLNRLRKPNASCSEKEKQLSIKLHSLLRSQRERRVKADYRIDEDVSRKEMRRQLADARQLFRACGD